MRPRLLLLAASTASLLSACSGDDAPLPVVIHGGTAVPWAATDLAEDLAATGAAVTREGSGTPECEDSVVHVVVAEAPDASLARQAFALDDDRCDDGGRVVTARGGSLLALQWAVYAVGEAAGLRYFHPEHTYRPLRSAWPEGSLARTESPRVRERTLAPHRTHPIELSPPFDLTGVDLPAHQQRWIGWLVKMRQTEASGWDAEHAGTIAYDRGFPRGAGFDLLSSQQGGRPILDPDDPRPEAEQLTTAIDQRLAPVDGLPPATMFDFTFNPSEFTEEDDQVTVRRLTTIADHIAENFPGVTLTTINHGTHGSTTVHYGVRFYDLPQFAPPSLGVQVHTLMFYDLERPAPVYGNRDFTHLGAWLRQEAAKRRVVHFPEASWWLTFDLPVPLYLAPVTLEARQKDLELLGDLWVGEDGPDTGLVGHNLFTSGQEWGYWLIDYCVSKMLWDRSSHGACLDDFTARMARGGELRAVLAEVEARQIGELRDPELLRFLVGSDDETEIALQAGIDFHPLPPLPADVVTWDDGRAAALEASIARLAAMGSDYALYADRVHATLADQDERQAPWVREIEDGLRIFGLRAAHAAEVYRTALALRAALAAGDLAAISAASSGLDRSRALTDAARVVVRAREADYRYPPALTIAGDEPGTPGAIENRTIYPYRYLGRTHRLFYWTRPDDQLAALFGEGIEAVAPRARMVKRGEALALRLLADGVEDLRVDWGDGTVTATTAPHTYERDGLFDWTLDARSSAGVLHHEDQAARVERHFVFAKRSLKVERPAGGAAIEGLLPGFGVGLGDDGQPFWAMGQIEGDELIEARGTLQRRGRTGMTAERGDLVLELRGVGRVTVYGASMTVSEGGGVEARQMVVEGEMVVQEVIDLLVSVGGFEPVGARALVASLLGFTPESLPARVPFLIRAEGAER